LQRMLGLGDGVLEAVDLVLGEGTHLGVFGQRLGLDQFRLQRAPFGDAGHDGLELGIFLGDGGDGIGRGARAKLRLEKLETLGDLAQAVLWKHWRDVPGRGPMVKGPHDQGAALTDRRRRSSA
jgi:hypothetical protein